MGRTALVALVLAGLAAPCVAETHEARTPRYRVLVEGTREEAEEAGRVLEAAWPAYAAHFGAEPRLEGEERLVVKLLASREAFDAALRADGVAPPPGAGGYYAPTTRTAYLYRQPTVYFTRVLLLHEAAHQFHYLACTDNRNPKAAWYTEGVAEYLALHRWDGERLEVGVVPGLSLEDYPAAALSEARREGFDLAALVASESVASRPIAWAIYRFLARGRDGAALPGLARFRRKLDAGTEAKAPFKVLAGSPSKLQPRLVAWLETQQSPWSPVFNEWEEIGEGRLRGHAGVVSACRRRGPSRRISATLEPPARGPWRAGLLLHLGAGDDYTVGLLDAGGSVRVHRRHAGAWQVLWEGRVAAASERPTFEAVRTGERVSFAVDGTILGAWPLPGDALGLALDACDVRFSDVVAR